MGDIQPAPERGNSSPVSQFCGMPFIYKCGTLYVATMSALMGWSGVLFNQKITVQLPCCATACEKVKYRVSHKRDSVCHASIRSVSAPLQLWFFGFVHVSS